MLLDAITNLTIVIKLISYYWWCCSLSSNIANMVNSFSLHISNFVYTVYVCRKLCGSHRYYNASLLFTHQQVAYELHCIVLFLIIEKFGTVWTPLAINVLDSLNFVTFKASKQHPDVVLSWLINGRSINTLAYVKLVYCYLWNSLGCRQSVTM